MDQNVLEPNELPSRWETLCQGLYLKGAADKHTLVAKLVKNNKKKALCEILKSINVSKAIDVGCGLGYTLSVFQDLGINTLGIDVSPTAVKICTNKGLRAVTKGVKEIEERYDLVFSDGLLEHFLDFQSYIRKFTEISSKYIIIIQTDHGNFFGKTMNYLTEILRGSKTIFEYNYRIENFVSVFEKYGFELVEIKGGFCGIFKLLLFQKKN